MKSLFDRCMLGLEKDRQIKIDSSVKERIWAQVLAKNLKTLREKFLLEFCERILGCFKEEELVGMLQEHTRTGCVRGLFYSARVNTAYRVNKEGIANDIVKRAESMKEDLILEIVDALRFPV